MTGAQADYPEDLLEWSGQRTGGVRRIFQENGGRPAGTLIPTPLLKRLEKWAAAFADGETGTPRVVLLVGGPGNGKTEAVEAALVCLDKALALDGAMIAELSKSLHPADDRPVPRKVQVLLPQSRGGASIPSVIVVQDASVRDQDEPSRLPADLLIADLMSVGVGERGPIYLACINRGVLDDSLIRTANGGDERVLRLLDAIVEALAMSATSRPCWPLRDHSNVAVWPMDAESLVSGDSDAADPVPGAVIVELATDDRKWQGCHACEIAERCPFCINRSALSKPQTARRFLQMLRCNELATGKRWNFRDLFSLVSYLLAGVPQSASDTAVSPCAWAKRQVDYWASTSSKKANREIAPFLLVSSLYQHALCQTWPAIGGRLRSALKELRHTDNDTLNGLARFLAASRRLPIPATLSAQLSGLCAALDPALADPDLEIDLPNKGKSTFREIDARYSQSVAAGNEFIEGSVSVLERDLLARLAAADSQLSMELIRRRDSAKAKAIQGIMRDFACRLVRRSIGVGQQKVRDLRILEEFNRVVSGDRDACFEAASEIENLLNDNNFFSVVLNGTFGEPLPPCDRRVVLTADKQKVSAMSIEGDNRPRAAVPFLNVGSGVSTQAIPLTYDLFKSICQLRAGMISAALPKAVIALLDTARARLGGHVVRDESELGRVSIRLGSRPEAIRWRPSGFQVVREDEQ